MCVEVEPNELRLRGGVELRPSQVTRGRFGASKPQPAAAISQAKLAPGAGDAVPEDGRGIRVVLRLANRRDETRLSRGEASIKICQDSALRCEKRDTVLADEAPRLPASQRQGDLVFLGLCHIGERLARPGGAMNVVVVAPLIPVTRHMDSQLITVEPIIASVEHSSTGSDAT